jgi:3',5'-cyclic AMP phosphodiesterase CpdA
LAKSSPNRDENALLARQTSSMRAQTLAHVSDLHFGLSASSERRAAELCETLVSAHVDHVVVTGDITHRGLREELARFRQVFRPLLDSGRLTVVPGNHDRMGEDLADELQAGDRVGTTIADGLFLVRVDSTGPHNRSLLGSRGHLSASDVGEIGHWLDLAPEGCMRVVLMHHHPLPLPEDTFSERMVSFFSPPVGAELDCGPQLVHRVYGRCELLLHGHRHRASELNVFLDDGPKPLSIFNAGISAQMGRVRIFTHADGRLVAPPFWLTTNPLRQRAPLWGQESLWTAARAIGLL